MIALIARNSCLLALPELSPLVRTAVQCALNKTQLLSQSMHKVTYDVVSSGNMAGESASVRSRLQANGAVKPLLHLLLAAQDHPEPSTLAAACTAAWALSNLLRDQSHAVSVTHPMVDPSSSVMHVCSSSPPDALVGMHWSVCVGLLHPPNGGSYYAVSVQGLVLRDCLT